MEIIDENTIRINGKFITAESTPGSRIIFKTNGIIIKLEKDDEDPIDWGQCAKEICVWNRVKDTDDARYFQPIIDSFVGWNHGWVAQEIIHFRKGRRPKWARDLIWSIGTRYGLIDLHCKNWGMTIEGQPIIFDYGY